MNTRMALIAVAGALMASVTPGLADMMPKDATPLTVDEVKAVYSDHTAQWGKPEAYFAPDGTVKGHVSDTWVMWGKWEVSGNQACMIMQAIEPKKKVRNGKENSDCWKWVKATDGKLWTLYTKSYDDKKQDLITGWNDNEVKNLKVGDLITAKYKALGGP